MSESEEPAGCEAPAMISMVWPGQGRQYWCINHAQGVINIASIMGLPVDSLDMKPVTGNNTRVISAWPVCQSHQAFEPNMGKT